jgi:hypothetical protein
MVGKTLENVSKVARKETNNDLRFKIYEKGSFNIHLKDMRPDSPLVKGGEKVGQISYFPCYG